MMVEQDHVIGKREFLRVFLNHPLDNKTWFCYTNLVSEH